jgi:transposase
MWTDAQRARHKPAAGQRYPSDLSDAEWALIAGMIPPARTGGRGRKTDMREVMNAILYVLRAGCQWRALPKDFPPRSTVYGYFWEWRRYGLLDRIQHALLAACRERDGREPSPSAAILDSQSVKAAEKGGAAGTRSATTRARGSRGSSAISSSTAAG